MRTVNFDRHGGLRRFTRTGTSSTERDAIRRLDFSEFLKNELAKRA